MYVGAVNQGQGKPLDYLAEVTGKSPAAVKNHLWQASRKGLLERSPGRVGGKITAEATKVLERIVPGADGRILVEGPPKAIGPRELKRQGQT